FLHGCAPRLSDGCCAACLMRNGFDAASVVAAGAACVVDLRDGFGACVRTMRAAVGLPSGHFARAALACARLCALVDDHADSPLPNVSLCTRATELVPHEPACDTCLNDCAQRVGM